MAEATDAPNFDSIPPGRQAELWANAAQAMEEACSDEFFFAPTFVTEALPWPKAMLINGLKNTLDSDMMELDRMASRGEELVSETEAFLGAIDDSIQAMIDEAEEITNYDLAESLVEDAEEFLIYETYPMDSKPISQSLRVQNETGKRFIPTIGEEAKPWELGHRQERSMGRITVFPGAIEPSAAERAEPPTADP